MSKSGELLNDNGPVDVKSLLWGNLLLLGFSPGGYPGVELHKDMFAGHIGASKAMTIVVYFLFQVIDPVVAKERFSSCWPVVDRIQGRDFRTVTFRWLEALKKEGRLPPDTSIRRSYLDECRGDRFERLVLALSNLALKAHLQHTCDWHGDDVTDLTSQSHSMHLNNRIEVLRTEHSSMIQRQLDLDTERATAIEELNARAAELRREHEALLDRQRIAARQYATVFEGLEGSFGTSNTLERARTEGQKRLNSALKGLAMAQQSVLDMVPEKSRFNNAIAKSDTSEGEGRGKGLDIKYAADIWSLAQSQVKSRLEYTLLATSDMKSDLLALPHDSYLESANSLKKHLSGRLEEIAARIEQLRGGSEDLDLWAYENMER
ncbi:HAUS augmin-like complex subunit 6 N-terminus-domain-containing protein [Phlyctochytrium arcticum]|nr:HAUS augmin-like complex subunit 6 N-terminus-domain-containing protein [Phlyctochytrium arcticum]